MIVQRIRIVTQEVSQVVEVRCDCCREKLHSVFPDKEGGWQTLQVVDGLHIALSGGYGEFFDGDTVESLFCQSCAKKLIGEFPMLLRCGPDHAA